MQYPGWLILNIHTLILAAFLLVFQRENQRTTDGRLFVRLVVMTMVLIVVDSIGDFFQQVLNIDSPLLRHAGTYLVFALDPVCYLFSILYIDHYIDAKRAKSRELFLTPMKIYVVVNLALVTLSTAFRLNWFYGYRDGVYFRGRLFLPRAGVNFLFCIMVQVYVLRYRRNINQAYRVPLSLFPALSLVGGVLQLVFAGLSCYYSTTMLACLLLFTFVQRVNLNMDYLTGTLNRRGLDLAFEQATAQANAGGYGAAMIDLDYFKQINDRYGHNKGDEALIAVAERLQRCFPQPAMSGRYGGDEFFVVYPGADRARMEASVAAFRKQLAEFNQSRRQPFAIEVSVGYDIYDRASGMDGAAFRHHVDQLMYAEKERRHACRK